jgi:octopine/nopaline transport system permease protein
VEQALIMASDHIAFLIETAGQIAWAIPVTLLIFAASALGATLLAAGLVALSVSPWRPLRLFQRGWTFLFRGTPLLLQIAMVYYGFATIPWIRHSFLWIGFRDPLFCACFAMTCCCSAYIGEVLRGALAAIPQGQIEAARACGMSNPTLIRRIVAPALTRVALPSYGNELIMMVKSTSLASTITVLDVTGVAQQVIAHSYRTLDVFCVAAAFYLAINASLAFLLSRAEAWPHIDKVSPDVPQVETMV